MPVAVVCLFFTSHKINTNRSPNTAKLFGVFFLPRRQLGSQGSAGGEACVAQKAQGTPEAPGALMGGGAHGGLLHRLSAL